ncbi:MAG: hypothetical protein RIE58_07210 [Vicingaceae bacterium]
MKISTTHRKMKYSRLAIMGMLSMSIVFTSCDKKEDEEPTPTTPTTPPPAAPENPIPGFIDGSGTLVGIQSRTFQNVPFVGTVPFDLGLAVAVFYNTPQDQTFLDAGTVTANSENLKKQNNNSYVYTPGPTNTEGIDFSLGEVDWSVSGSTDIPAFNRTNFNGFPEVDELTSEKTIDRSMDYTLSSASISGADSIIFMIGGILHIVAGGNNSSTFTAAELGTLNAGQNFAQITGYNYTFYSDQGKKFYYVNETVVTQSVTLK